MSEIRELIGKMAYINLENYFYGGLIGKIVENPSPTTRDAFPLAIQYSNGHADALTGIFLEKLVIVEKEDEMKW